MMKFFRKHMRKLLAAAMCLLLISWLGGNALQSMMMPDQGGTVWATYVDGEIIHDEQRLARQQTELLGRLGLSWDSAFEQYAEWLQLLNRDWQIPPGRYQFVPLDAPSWLLLQREAHRMGIHSSRADVQAMLEDYRRAMARMKQPVPSVEFVAHHANVKTEVVYDAVTAFTDIVRYGSRVARAAAVNTAETRRCADDTYSRVQVKALVLRAEMFDDPEASFPEAEMREQFDKFQNQKHSGTGLNFGYVLPPRVKVQYARIDPHRIEEALSSGDAAMLAKAGAGLSPDDEQVWEQAKARLSHGELKDMTRANRYWRKHQQDPAFLRPPDEAEDPATTQAAEETTTQPVGDAEPTTQPTTAPSGEPEPAFYSSWKNEPELWKAALGEIRRNDAAEQARALADWLLEQMAEPWDHADVASNGYKIPVEVVKQMNHFEQKLAAAPANLSGTEAVTIETTAWISPENVFDVPGIGTSALANPAGAPIRFSDVIFHVEGLIEIPTGDDAVGVDRGSFMALYQTCRYALTDEDGNIYVVRPVEVDAERPARGLDEVRDQVVGDLHLARAYEKAEAAAKAFREKALAGEGGLQAAWESDESLKESVERYNKAEDDPTRQSGFHDGVSVSRRGMDGTPVKSVRLIGAVEESFLDACFAMREVAAPEDRLRAIAMPESATVLLVEWRDNFPLNQQLFNALQRQVIQQLEQQRIVNYVSLWLTPKQIKARNQFNFARGS